MKEMFYLMINPSGEILFQMYMNWKIFINFSDGGWDDKEAAVICQMLGHGSSGAYAKHNSNYGQISTASDMDYLECDGKEKIIGMCQFKKPKRNCLRDVAGVICGMVGKTSSTPLKLVGGPDSKSGNVILYGQPIW